MIKTKQEKAFEVFASVVMICVMVIVIFPFILLFISSITDEDTLLINGYSIFPEKLSFGAYKYIWNSRDVIFRAYGITICVTVIGTLAHVAIVAMAAYPLSLRNMPGRSFFSFVILFTMLFNGGLVPTYIIYTMVFPMFPRSCMSPPKLTALLNSRFSDGSCCPWVSLFLSQSAFSRV